MLAWASVATAQEEGAAGLAPAGPVGDPDQSQPAQTEPGQTEPGQTEQTQPAQTQPAQTQPAQTQPAQTQPGAQPAPNAPVFQDQQPAGVPTAPPGYGQTAPQGQGYGQQPGYNPRVAPTPNFQLRQPQLDPQTAARIDALMQQRNQIRVGGWIAMMAAGAATTAVSVLFAIAFADVERDDTGCSRCGDNTGTITFSAISIVTAAVAVTGFLMFLRRAKERKVFTRQIRDLRQGAMQRQVALLEF